MKKIKEIFTRVKELQHVDNEDITPLIWQLICYSPKFPLRLPQQQLLNEASPFTLEVDDPHFSQSILKFNGYIWGNGSHKVLLTHGWSSKGADFIDLITALRAIDDLQIIAFDAPGNGSSEGELSNLLLFAEAVKAVISTYGAPDIMIGHSLGVMANTIAIQQTGIKPSLLISVTPMVNLRENFIATMNSADVPKTAQGRFFENFNEIFDVPTSYFNLADIYNVDIAQKHWLAYDRDDKMTPFPYTQELLNRHPMITSKEYPDATHERIIKDPRLIADVLELVRNNQ